MNLHSLSSRGSGVCRSLFLRTFMVMILFITGSNGIYAGEGVKDLAFAKRDELKNKDLSLVDKILFGGFSTSGTITLDPESIVSIGQSQVKVSPSDAAKGTVYFTVGNDTQQYTEAKVPNHTKVKFYAQPNTEKVVFTGWDVAGKVIYDNPAEVEVTGDLNVIARFPDGIHISCTVDPNGAAEPVVYQKDHPEWPLPANGKVGETENSGKCIIRRQVKNNSGEASADLSILYPFAITEDGEYYVKVERGNNQNTCTALAIHTNEYAPNLSSG